MDSINVPYFKKVLSREMSENNRSRSAEKPNLHPCKIYYNPMPVSPVRNIEYCLPWDMHEADSGSANPGEEYQIGNKSAGIPLH